MGWTSRKSFKVMPGVRVTVSPRGISASAGIPGYRVTKGADGRVTRTASLPGTGIRHTTSAGSRPPARTAPPAASPAKPGLLAPKWEKELHTALAKGNWDDLPRIGQAYLEAAPVAVTLDAFHQVDAGNPGRATELLRWAWRNAGVIEDHPFVKKYISRSEITVPIAAGVTATLPISRDAIGLALAEAEQAVGNLPAAIDIVESLDPSSIAAVSLCELYLETGRWDDIVDVTNGVENTDDPTALLAAYRGIALREQGLHTAALEAFREGLRSSKRDREIRHLALIERARTYAATNKKAMARKDLEKILAENSNREGVREFLATLI